MRGVTQRVFPVTVFLLLTLFGSFGEGIAQNIERSHSTTPPNEERLEVALDLITVDGSKTKEGIFGDTIKLYDGEGTLWWEYRLDDDGISPLHVSIPKKVNLIFPGNFRFFKLTGFSKSWYKVEIDSVSGESKFMRVDDPFLRRDELALRLKLSPYIGFNRSSNPLRVEKGGRTVDSDLVDPRVRAVAIEGDWAQVEVQEKTQNNNRRLPLLWLRWRQDNKLLVSIGYR
jgi:hypothetical protein